jgi:polyferredoxin
MDQINKIITDILTLFFNNAGVLIGTIAAVSMFCGVVGVIAISVDAALHLLPGGKRLRKNFTGKKDDTSDVDFLASLKVKFFYLFISFLALALGLALARNHNAAVNALLYVGDTFKF